MAINRFRPVWPGAGFRIWLATLGCVSAFSGFAASLDAWLFVWLLTPPLAFFLLLNLIPVGVALWVSVRHLRHGCYSPALSYGALPFVAIFVAFASAWAGFNGEVQIRLLRYERAIAAARTSGAVVNTEDVWIDPGPPTRARFSHGGSVLAAFYVIYAESSDQAWLKTQADSCKGSPWPQGRNFYQIGGSC